MGSPLVRTPLQSVLVREIGPDINQPATQTIQPRSEPTQIGVTENALHEDLLFLLLEPNDSYLLD